MKLRKVIGILAAAVMLAAFAQPALADNMSMNTLVLKGMDRTVTEWTSSKNNREMFACVAMVDLVLTVGDTSYKDTVIAALSSAMAADKCYVSISNGGKTVSTLFFGDKNTIVIFYSPSTDHGEWNLVNGSPSDAAAMMTELKDSGAFDTYYKVSGANVLQILQQVSASLGN